MKKILLLILISMSFISNADVFCLKASDLFRSFTITDSGLLQTAVDGVTGRIKGHGVNVDWFRDTIIGHGVHIKVLDIIPEEIDQRKLSMNRAELDKLFTLDVKFGLGGFYHVQFLCRENSQLFVSFGRKLGDYQIK